MKPKPNHLKIALMLSLPTPSSQATGKPRKPPVEERVRDAMDLCESGHESLEEWEFLRRVHNYLQKKKKLTSRQARILKELTPFIRKHASASGGEVLSDSTKPGLFDDC